MRPPTAGEAAAAALAAPLAAWAGFVAAPALDGGGSLASLIAAFSDPFSTKPTAGGARWALLFLVLYAACAAAWLLTRRNLRPGEEHGSAGGVTPAASATATGGATPQATSCSRAIFA